MMEGISGESASLAGRLGAGLRKLTVLLDLVAHALLVGGELGHFSGHVSDSGEGRWTSLAAIETGVPVPVLSSALYARFSSRDAGEFENCLLSAMRSEFGGHAEE